MAAIAFSKLSRVGELVMMSLAWPRTRKSCKCPMCYGNHIKVEHNNSYVQSAMCTCSGHIKILGMARNSEIVHGLCMIL